MSRITSLRLLATLLLVLAVHGGTSAQAQAAASAPDRRVEAALEGAKLGFRIDAGDYRLDYTVDETRSQRVWVASGTTSLPPLEVRDVWSVAARGKGTVPADLAVHLLQENVRMVLGAWQVNQGKDEYLVVFSAQVNADADAAALREVIEVVMYSADRVEKELSGKDEF
ncbi:MAG: hypothetical protein OEY13_08375 [Gammaproteobacteria bacterium]|nr:hypothetical protein [Gammaproteobacteria bacterium]